MSDSEHWQAVEKVPSRSLDDDWCSVSEAARRLSVTPTAIRNRIKRGTLETRPNGNFGRMVRVPRTVSGTGSGTVLEAAVPGTVTAVEELVSELRDRVSDLKARLAAADIERMDLRREMAQERAQAAQERDRLQDALVTAGKRLDAVLSAQKAESERHGREADELRREIERLRRPWWRWWRA